MWLLTIYIIIFVLIYLFLKALVTIVRTIVRVLFHYTQINEMQCQAIMPRYIFNNQDLKCGCSN